MINSPESNTRCLIPESSVGISKTFALIQVTPLGRQKLIFNHSPNLAASK